MFGKNRSRLALFALTVFLISCVAVGYQPGGILAQSLPFVRPAATATPMPTPQSDHLYFINGVANGAPKSVNGLPVIVLRVEQTDIEGLVGKSAHVTLTSPQAWGFGKNTQVNAKCMTKPAKGPVPVINELARLLANCWVESFYTPPTPVPSPTSLGSKPESNGVK